MSVINHVAKTSEQIALKYACSGAIGGAFSGAFLGAITGYGITNTSNNSEKLKCGVFVGVIGAAMGAFVGLVKGYDEGKKIGLAAATVANADLIVNEIPNLFRSIFGSLRYQQPQ